MRASIGILRRDGNHLVLNSDTIDINDAFEADGPTQIRGAFGTRDFDRIID